MLAERIKEYAAEMGIKQNAVAKAAGISASAMSEAMRGNRRLTAEEYVAICDFLNVPYSKFIDGANAPAAID